VWEYRIAASGEVWLSAAALVLVLTLALALMGALPSPARAGTWMQVSCVNPDGSAAPSEGWTGFGQGGASFGSDNNSRCSPGSPMAALLGDTTPAPDGASENLQYTPPAGSTLVGGTVNLTAYADGGSTYARAIVGLYEPQLANDESDAFFSCVEGLGYCNGGNDYSGVVTLPTDRGGSLYLGASCTALGSNTCDSGASHGAWALGEISAAQLLLSSGAAPEAVNFGGSALQPGARGTAALVFTASDTGGPGVYAVSVALDGRPVWAGTPNANGGECVPRSTDPATGALMFDNQQPCPVTEVVDVPVPTATLPDGSHQLTATLIDAARNTSTVLDRRITTSNPQYTPVARRGVRAQFVISWQWLGRHTTLRSLSVRRLPGDGRVSVHCRGRGCPKLKVTSVPARRITRLLHALRGRRFVRNDTLLITVSAPHRRAERVLLTILNNRKPTARLVTG
jgi:hypothetical protein